MDDVATLVAEAREKERLDDLGPGAFEEPLGILLDSYTAAGLNEVGTFILRQGVVHSLRTVSYTHLTLPTIYSV